MAQVQNLATTQNCCIFLHIYFVRMKNIFYLLKKSYKTFQYIDILAQISHKPAFTTKKYMLFLKLNKGDDRSV